MAREPENLILSILREVQATLSEHGRDLSTIKNDLRRQGVRIDELFESSTMALGLAGHANVCHNTVQKELDELKTRVERLEEKL